MATIALVDDHVLLRNGLASMVRNLGYDVTFEADNGDDFTEKLALHGNPEIVLMDINMPQKDGYAATAWLKEYHPDIKVLALSMLDDENAVIRMLKSGAKGYVLKDAEPSELRTAIDSLVRKGFYYSELVTGRLMRSITDEELNGKPGAHKLTEREIDFLKLACTEMTYKEIADKMYLSPRTIDGYRDALFEKLDIKTRVGLVLYAIKHNIVQV
jgi:DNA-binding NarL/FixJ family response regulator